MNTHSSDGKQPDLPEIELHHQGSRKNSFIVIEKNPFKHMNKDQKSNSPDFTKRLSNVKSAESLKLELNL